MNKKFKSNEIIYPENKIENTYNTNNKFSSKYIIKNNNSTKTVATWIKQAKRKNINKINQENEDLKIEKKPIKKINENKKISNLDENITTNSNNFYDKENHKTNSCGFNKIKQKISKATKIETLELVDENKKNYKYKTNTNFYKCKDDLDREDDQIKDIVSDNEDNEIFSISKLIPVIHAEQEEINKNYNINIDKVNIDKDLVNTKKELENEININKTLENQIEKYKKEFEKMREELAKKSDLINELNQKIFELENENIIKDKQLVDIELLPSIDHYNELKNEYNEAKIKLNNANDEIKNLKLENSKLLSRNEDLFEENQKLFIEVKLYQNNNNNYSNNNYLKKSNNKSTTTFNTITKENNEIMNPYINTQNSISYLSTNNKSYASRIKRNKSKDISSNYLKKKENAFMFIDKDNVKDLISLKYNDDSFKDELYGVPKLKRISNINNEEHIFNKNNTQISQKEMQIIEMENNLYELQKERDKINDEYLKYSEFPKKREEINAKRKLEIQLEELNKSIHSQKLKIREQKK